MGSQAASNEAASIEAVSSEVSDALDMCLSPSCERFDAALCIIVEKAGLTQGSALTALTRGLATVAD
ncbi:MAG: hypothetical protein RBU37_15360 [Myxococcota bacterium]|nr:hypothetical protein [Myxococcota bacterium]